jgi:outer membrane protein TolC
MTGVHQRVTREVAMTLRLLALSCLLLPWTSRAAPADVVFVVDAWGAKAALTQKVVSVTQDLLGASRTVRVTPVATPAEAGAAVTSAWSEDGVRVVVSLGILANAAVSKGMNGQSPPRPTLSVGIIDPALQAVPLTPKGTSGLKNFGYVMSTADVKRDFALLQSIRPYTHLAVISPPGIEAIFPPAVTLLKRNLPDPKIELTMVHVGPDGKLGELPANTDAAYVLPLFHLDDTARKGLYEGLAAKGIPSVALIGRPEVELGAYASVAPVAQLDTVARRVALDISRALDGREPADFPVRVGAYSPDVVFNMHAIRKSGVYPPFDVINPATLVAVTRLADETKLGLQAAVAEGLKTNFDLQRVRLDVPIAIETARSARGGLLPSVTASTSVAAIDQLSVDQAFGTRYQTTWSGALELQQVIFADAAWANYTVQTLLTEASRLGVKGAELQVVRDVATAYLGILQAKNLVRLQNRNVSVSKQNQDLAVASKAAGGANAADIHRWESQLALGKMDLLDAEATLEQARQNLNRLLGRAIAAPIDVVDLSLEEVIELLLDRRVGARLNNGGEVQQFAHFLAKDAIATTPILQQIDRNLEAQERLAINRNRQIWLPTVAASASLSKPFAGWGEAEGMMTFGEPRTEASWNIGVVASLPIFDGLSNYAENDKAKLQVTQLQRQRALTQQGIEAQIRGGMAVVGRRFARIRLARKAAEASAENLRIVQSAYAIGEAPIAQVIDAQAALLRADILASNAVYDFVASYLDIELARGWFNFLAPPEQRDAFLARFEAHLKGDTP